MDDDHVPFHVMDAVAAAELGGVASVVFLFVAVCAMPFQVDAVTVIAYD